MKIISNAPTSVTPSTTSTTNNAQIATVEFVKILIQQAIQEAMEGEY